MSAAPLIYPLRVEANALHYLLVRTFGPKRGRCDACQTLIDAIGALERSESIARKLTPFDPSGL